MSSVSHDSSGLLVDGDNPPTANIDFIISELASHGLENIRRACGNWKKPSSVATLKDLKGDTKLMNTLRNAGWRRGQSSRKRHE